MKTVVAGLIHDSRLHPCTTRFAGLSSRFHLVYLADRVEIDIVAERVIGADEPEGRWQLRGQVSTSASCARLVATRPENGDDVEAPCDEHGMFDIALPTGTYDLRAVGSITFEIRGVGIG